MIFRNDWRMDFETVDPEKSVTMHTSRQPADGQTTDGSLGGTKPGILHTIPSRIGPYYVDRFLGSGLRSEVYAVHDDRDNHLALKIVSADDVAVTERLYREFRARDAISDFSHIAKAYQPHEYTVDDIGVVGYPIELFPGNLRILIPRLAKMAPTDRLQEVVVRWVPQIAAGVSACHAAGVLHLDLKPGNILYDPDTARLAVADFGISSTEVRQSNQGASSGTGTLAYWAPEQALNHPPDERADVYALGVILAEMLTGSPGGGGIDHFPEQIVSVVDICTRRDRSRRYASVADFSTALHQAVCDEETASKAERTEAKLEYPALSGSLAHRTRTLVQLRGDDIAVVRVSRDGETTLRTMGAVRGTNRVHLLHENAFRWGAILIGFFFGIPFLSLLVVGTVTYFFAGNELGSEYGLSVYEAMALGGFSGLFYALPVMAYIFHLRLPKVGRIKGGWKPLSYAKVTLRSPDGNTITLPIRRGDAEELQLRIG